MDTQIRIEYEKDQEQPFFESPPEFLYASTVSEAADLIRGVLELGDGLPSKVERVNADGEVEATYDINVNVLLTPTKHALEE